MTYTNSFISLFIIAIIVLIAWTTFTAHSPTTPPSLSTLPDAYMEEVVALIMDKEGKLNIKIKTPKMIHYAKNDISELSHPQLTIYRNSPQPWLVTSKFARARQGVEHVDFWEEVNIHHAADTFSPTTEIKTTKLTVYPNKQRAETDAIITLVQPNIIVNATGMVADMNSGDIKLLSRARGEYASGY